MPLPIAVVRVVVVCVSPLSEMRKLTSINKTMRTQSQHWNLKTIIALTHLSPSSFLPPHIPSSSNTNAIHEIVPFYFGFVIRQLQEPGYYWAILSKLVSNFQAMKLESFFLSSREVAIFSAQSSSSFSYSRDSNNNNKCIQAHVAILNDRSIQMILRIRPTRWERWTWSEFCFIWFKTQFGWW